MAPRWVPDSPRGGAFPVWTRALAAEHLAKPVLPLEHDLLWGEVARPAWRAQLVAEHGFDPTELPEGGAGLIGFFDGYAYVNASLLRAWAERLPTSTPDQVDHAYLGHHPGLPPCRAESGHESTPCGGVRLSEWVDRLLVDGDRSVLEADHHASIHSRADRPDLPGLTDQQLVERVLVCRPLCGRLFAHYLSHTLAASIGPAIVSAACHEVGRPGIYPKLIAGLGDVDTVTPIHALWMLSRAVASSTVLTRAFEAGASDLLPRLRASTEVDAVAFVAGVETLLGEIGFVGSAPWELSSPSWECEPSLALSAIDWLRRCGVGRDPSIGFARCESERTTLVKEIGDIVAARPGVTSRKELDAGILATEVFVRARERSRWAVSRVVNEIRMALRELGERATARSDIEHPEELYLLWAHELYGYVSAGRDSIAEVVADRRSVLRRVMQHEPPFVVAGVGPAPPISPLSALFGETPPMEVGEVLLAEPGSAGRSRGRARVVDEIGPAAPFEPGDVVVTGLSTAGWLPYAAGLRALVVESGGVLSPPAVIGRELGLPVVVGALDATTRVPDGALVEVDGETGIVTLIESAGNSAPSRPDRRPA